MTGRDVNTYEEGNSYHIVISNVNTESDKEQIYELVRAFLGLDEELMEYSDADDLTDEEAYEYPEGNLNVVPEGRFRGYTVQDVYNENGHESLVQLLLNVKKMKSATPEAIQDLYKEAIEFAIYKIREREVDLEGFVRAYKPFLGGNLPGISGTPDEWLSLPPREQQVLYEDLISCIIHRMQKSIQ